MLTPPPGLGTNLSATWPDSISDILENAFATSSSPTQRSETSFSFSVSHSQSHSHSQPYAPDESLTTVGSTSLPVAPDVSSDLLSKVAAASETAPRASDTASVSAQALKVSRRSLSSRTRKHRGSALVGHTESDGYRAWTLHTSSSGRAVLGVKTRAFETVAAHPSLVHPACAPASQLTPPPEDEDEAEACDSGLACHPYHAARIRLALDARVPLEVRKSLRTKAELWGPPQSEEGDVSYASVREWAESDDLPSPPPEDSRQLQADTGSKAAPSFTPGSNTKSQQDQIKLYSGDTGTAAVSPLAPTGLALGLLKPPTPSKAQYVFSEVKYNNVLGRSASVVPLRCASAPEGLSLRFKKRASAFTTLRVALEPIVSRKPQAPSQTASAGPVSEVGKRQYTAQNFSRTPSLDAVMQRGEIRDRDAGHVFEQVRKRKRAQPTDPAQQKASSKQKRAKFVRASTPVLSPPKPALVEMEAMDELDSNVSQSSVSEGEDELDTSFPDTSSGSYNSSRWEGNSKAPAMDVSRQSQARPLERYGSTGRSHAMISDRHAAASVYANAYGSSHTRPSFSAERHGASPINPHGSRDVGRFAYQSGMHSALPPPRGDPPPLGTYGWSSNGNMIRPSVAREGAFARSTTWPNNPTSVAGRMGIQSAIRGRYPGGFRAPEEPAQTPASVPGPRLPPLLAHLTSEAANRMHVPLPAPTSSGERLPPATWRDKADMARPELSRSTSSSRSTGSSSSDKKSENEPFSKPEAGPSADPTKRYAVRATIGKMDRVLSAPSGRTYAIDRTPLSLLANQRPSTSPGRGDETEQQQAAAELLLAFGQGRD